MAVLPLYLDQIDDLDDFRYHFWKQVDRTGNCWLWKSRLDRNGYGHVGVPINGRYRTYLAHRVSYLLAYRSLSADMMVCHKCDVRACVLPNHLFEGTASENTQDMWDKGRGNTHFAVGEIHGLTKLTTTQVVEIRSRYSGGESAKALAASYDVAAGSIYNIVRQRTWRHIADAPPPPPRQGQRNGRARLLPVDVREIRRRHALGETYPALADAFRVSPSAIGHIISGKNWRHIT